MSNQLWAKKTKVARNTDLTLITDPKCRVPAPQHSLTDDQ